MNSERTKLLEEQIDRALKALPDLEAPATLAPRVMKRIAELHFVPWYRRPWQSWSTPLRVLSLSILLLSFGGVCFASWRLTQAAGYAAALEEVRGVFSGVSVIWNTLNVLLGAVVLAIKSLGTPLLLGCMTAAALSYAICIGLGTMVFRMVFARHN